MFYHGLSYWNLHLPSRVWILDHSLNPSIPGWRILIKHWPTTIENFLLQPCELGPTMTHESLFLLNLESNMPWDQHRRIIANPFWILNSRLCDSDPLQYILCDPYVIHYGTLVLAHSQQASMGLRVYDNLLREMSLIVLTHFTQETESEDFNSFKDDAEANMVSWLRSCCLRSWLN